MPPISDEMSECIDHCQRCQEACLETLGHCLELGGKHAEPDHLRLLMACAEVCDTSATLMLIGSRMHTRTCEVCAEFCEACAKACEAFAGDEMMQRCAEACRRCERSCRQMSAGAC